jgi:hypothetical protein
MAGAWPCSRRNTGTLASAAILALTLATCDRGTPAPAGGVSQGEAEALAQAAEMLDESRQLPEAALPEMAVPSERSAAPGMSGDTAR